MLIFGLYEGQRLTLDVAVGKKVKDVRELIQRLLNITEDNAKHDKKVLVLSWAGSDLQDPWVFSDLGIVPGSTIHVFLKEEVKPVLHIHCSHSQETLSVYDNMVIGHMHMEELRSLASRKTGLPVGIFRLVLKDGTEMYDGHLLEAYGIDVGHTVHLETLDGWSEFLNLAVMGFTPQVISQISSEEFTGRYQMKVALFLAAHFGHVDLARTMLRQGIKASEAVGYPPQRMWCCQDKGHVESLKAPVHQAVEMGQLGVLRVFVNNDITVVTARDGDGLAPLNIALRALVGFGVCVDGFSPSIMTGKTKAQVQREKEREEKKRLQAARQSRSQRNPPEPAITSGNDPQAYFKQVVAIQTLKSMGDKVKGAKWGRITRTASRPNLAPPSDAGTSRSQKTPEPTTLPKLRFGGSANPPDNPSAAEDTGETSRLPPIHITTARTPKTTRARTHGMVTQSQQSVVTITSSGAESDKDSQHQQQQQIGGSVQGASVTGSGEEERREGKGVMMPRLVTSRGRAYFMTGGSKQPTSNPPSIIKVPSLQLPSTDRSERGKATEVDSSQADTGTSRLYFADLTDTPSTPVEETLAQHPTTTTKKDSIQPTARTTTTDATGPMTSTRSLPAGHRKRKKKKRVTSALLLSKATANEGAIPLPIISTERDRRPFFYYNGKREDAFVLPTISTWSQHVKTETGATPRERAIKSMSVANTFKDKPWLRQVQIALKIATNPTKRNVRRLRGASKGTFAV